MIKNIVRRLTGAVKNGVVWGVTWSALAFVTILGLRTLGVVVRAEITVLDAIGMAIRVGIAGGLAGGVFALFVSRFYRGRRLSGIHPVRFGVGGAVVAGVFMVAFFTLPRLLSGEGLQPLGDIVSDLIIAAAFGGIAAGASMWLAQRTEGRSIGGPDEHGHLRGGPVPGMEEMRHRTHVRARP